MRFDITSRRPNKWILVFLATQQPHEVQRWRFLASVAHMAPLRRRVIGLLVRELEARGLLDVRSRKCAARKAGAT